ncbi:helix-turn-helix transcriptional regulator [Oceanicoccus sagamiensis]|uniref:HTH araC/xylS-type domain-containing protein n=1 Tax=Oceanicoccus sagamiensis TaxID=716816 RepID=A0A1X9NFR2_9GAMM|nr:AraC family transcriptional regulator [Oceanicoccus sagamiensis]ARN73797.1 hypothetical protein BST96_06530 [Oceanicoccus sagamiensis]
MGKIYKQARTSFTLNNFTASQQGAVTRLVPNAPECHHLFGYESQGAVDPSEFFYDLRRLVAQGDISSAVRFCLPDHEEEFHFLSNGFILQLFRDVRPALMRGSYYSEQWISLRVFMQGKPKESFNESLPFDCAAQCTFLNFGQGLRYTYDMVDLGNHSSVHLVFKPEQLARFVAPAHRHYIQLLATNADAHKLQDHLLVVPLTADIYRLAREILDLTSDNPFYHFHTESRSLELLTQAIRSLYVDNLSSVGSVRLNQRDIQKLEALKARLHSDYAESFTLDDLSRWVGFNRRKLTEGFKALYGVTVNEYLLSQRMTNARLLLREGAAVSEVSEQVGYTGSSSFGKAFKRYFGTTPKESRQLL